MSKLVLTQGCIAEPIANFNKTFDGYDEGATSAQVEYQISSGVKGLVANSFAGDALFLRDDMDIRHVALLAKLAAGRVPVFAQVIDNGTWPAVEKIKKYRDAGADVVLVAQPAYFEKKAALQRHFEIIFESAPDVTMGIHNGPDLGVTLTPELQAHIANYFDNCAYLINSTQSMAHIQTLHLLVKNPNVRFLEGTESTILAAMADGSHGAMSSLAALVPKLVSGLCDAWLAGDWKLARDLNDKVIWLDYINERAASGDRIRFLADLLGKFPGGHPVAPRNPISEADAQYLRAEYAKLDWLPSFL